MTHICILIVLWHCIVVKFVKIGVKMIFVTSMSDLVINLLTLLPNLFKVLFEIDNGYGHLWISTRVFTESTNYFR